MLKEVKRRRRGKVAQVELKRRRARSESLIQSLYDNHMIT